ncbi:MAG TPA: maleylpyruvate isomerase family mycothiol-dependent enzyme [Actinomycetota bacterium]|nr:maleylpyruvate isomerase family mycothiol-dependent enzyme [Actinomycetota bacterium]
MDKAAIYRAARERILALVRQGPTDVEVPTTPGWTVKDLVAHLAAFLTVYRAQGREGFGPGWGDREVAARRDMSLEEAIAEWDEGLSDLGDLFDSPLGTVAVADVLAHEQDIRTAIDRPGASDDPGIPPSVEMALAFLTNKPDVADLPSIRVVTEDVDRTIGDGPPVATLRTTTFELFRVLHGRRTVEQVRDMDWDGDPGGWAESLFIFGPTERVVEEAAAS